VSANLALPALRLAAAAWAAIQSAARTVAAAPSPSAALARVLRAAAATWAVLRAEVAAAAVALLAVLSPVARARTAAARALPAWAVAIHAGAAQAAVVAAAVPAWEPASVSVPRAATVSAAAAAAAPAPLAPLLVAPVASASLSHCPRLLVAGAASAQRALGPSCTAVAAQEAVLRAAVRSRWPSPLRLRWCCARAALRPCTTGGSRAPVCSRACRAWKHSSSVRPQWSLCCAGCCGAVPLRTVMGLVVSPPLSPRAGASAAGASGMCLRRWPREPWPARGCPQQLPVAPFLLSVQHWTPSLPRRRPLSLLLAVRPAARTPRLSVAVRGQSLRLRCRRHAKPPGGGDVGASRAVAAIRLLVARQRARHLASPASWCSSGPDVLPHVRRAQAD
jgi:hypothetical protein